MLFVGNHQTYALDIGFLVEQLVKERGIMPRGLAHPAIFAVRAGSVVAAHLQWRGPAVCYLLTTCCRCKRRQRMETRGTRTRRALATL